MIRRMKGTISAAVLGVGVVTLLVIALNRSDYDNSSSPAPRADSASSSKGPSPDPTAHSQRQLDKTGNSHERDKVGEAEFQKPGAPEAQDAAKQFDELVGKSMSQDPKEEIDYAERLKDWDEFYDVVKHLQLRSDQYMQLIVERVRKELNLSSEDYSLLVRLIKDEQNEVTEELTKAYGGPDKLIAQVKSQRVEFWDEIRRLRAKVRARYEDPYASIFDKSQLALINEHLRNDKITVAERFTRDGGREVLVGGVGKIKRGRAKQITPESEGHEASGKSNP